MANEKNLIPFTSDQNREEAKKNGRKGGVASGKAKAKKKLMKELAMELINNSIADEKLVERILSLFPQVSKQDMQVQTAMLVAQINKALKGDSKAFEVVRDTAGQKPIEQTVVAFDENNELIIDLDDED